MKRLLALLLVSLPAIAADGVLDPFQGNDYRCDTESPLCIIKREVLRDLIHSKAPTTCAPWNS